MCGTDAADTDTGGGRAGPAADRLSGEIDRLVSRRFGVPAGMLRGAGRCGRAVAMARHVAIYLERVVLELSCREVGRRFMRHPSAVIHACRRVEERRDDARFDRRLAAIEAAVAARMAEPGP